MPSYSEADKILIQNLRQQGWSARRMLNEFPNKEWTRSGLDHIIKKVDDHGTADRLPGSGRPRSARTPENIAMVEPLVLSQEGAAGSHESPREIAAHTNISRSSVQRIVKEDLQLQVFKRQKVQQLTDDNKEKRVACCQKLLDRFPNHTVRRIWFTDEKTFSLRSPINSQNDRVYAPLGTKKREISPDRLLREHQHFTQKVMVSAGVSKMGKTRIVFIDQGAKVNAEYYCDSVLTNGLLPDMRRISGDNFVLQQDGARSHTARLTLEYLRSNVADFIEPESWPPSSPDLNPLDYRIWAALQEKVYRNGPFQNLDDLRQAVVQEWDNISQRFVIATIDQWKDRLRQCLNQHGAHIEHLF